MMDVEKLEARGKAHKLCRTFEDTGDSYYVRYHEADLTYASVRAYYNGPGGRRRALARLIARMDIDAYKAGLL